MAIFNEEYIQEFFFKKKETEEEKINRIALSEEDYNYLNKNFGKKQKVPNCIKFSDINNIDYYAYGLFNYTMADLKKFAKLGKAKDAIKYIDTYIKDLNDEIEYLRKSGESDSDIKHDSAGIGNPIDECKKLLKYKEYILKYPTLFLADDGCTKENCDTSIYIGGEINKIITLTNNNDDYIRVIPSSFSWFLNSFNNKDDKYKDGYDDVIKYTKKKYGLK